MQSSISIQLGIGTEGLHHRLLIRNRVIGMLHDGITFCHHTVHIAFGTNIGFQGTNKADCHIDGVILNPTLYLDDQLILKDGEFVI